MSPIPYYSHKENFNYHPHVIILGAGASLAALPNGDKFFRKLPLMKNIVDIVGLKSDLQALGISQPENDFEELFERLNLNLKDNIYLKNIKTKIYQYFESLKLPDSLTIYDKLILSLREKDLIATFNWDPLLGLAFQRNRHIQRLPQIIFLHGNVFIGICKEHRVKGFRNCVCSKCGKRFGKLELLYPIKDKNYTENDFIKNEWDLLKTKLNEAYLVTIFGYSAPKTDVASREIMFQVLNKNNIREFLQIEIIDIEDEETIKNNWSEFFIRNHYTILNDINNSLISCYPRRSCEAFASATLYNSPWGNFNRYKGNSLREFQQRIIKMIESENLHNKNNSFPLSKW